MSVPNGFIMEVAEKYVRGELSRGDAVIELVKTLEVTFVGAEEILDGALDDLTFFYADDE